MAKRKTPTTAAAYNGYPDPDHHAERLARARAVAAAWAATVPADLEVLDALRRDVRAPGGPVDVMTEILTGNDTRSDDAYVLDDVAEASTDVGALLAEALRAREVITDQAMPVISSLTVTEPLALSRQFQEIRDFADEASQCFEHIADVCRLAAAAEAHGFKQAADCCAATVELLVSQYDSIRLALQGAVTEAAATLSDSLPGPA